MVVEKIKLSVEYLKFKPKDKVLVIGGGVGLSYVKSLSELGLDVTLVEEKTLLGRFCLSDTIPLARRRICLYVYIEMRHPSFK